MLGGCIENSCWLSALGLNTQDLIAAIGQILPDMIVVAITSPLSGVCVDVLVLKGDGYRFYRLHLLASVAFLNFALPKGDFGAILVTYMLRRG